MRLINKHKQRLVITFAALLVLAAGVGLYKIPRAKAAATIRVNSVLNTAANDGVCTLREAITAANTDTASGAAGGECIAGNGMDTINFADISGTGIKTIALTSALPSITAPVTIDGYTRADSSVNTNAAPLGLNTVIRMAIDGSSCGSACSINIISNNVTIKGLSIHSMTVSTAAIYSTNSSSVVIEGNFIGVTAAGVEAGNTLDGVSFGPGTQNSRIGGSLPAQRNLVSGNSTATPSSDNIIVSDDSTNTTSNITISGNIVGTNAAGTANFTNPATGIRVKDGVKNFTIGGPATTDGNLVAGFVSTGIVISQEDDTGSGVELSNGSVQNNYVGYGSNLTTNLALANTNSGIGIVALAPNIVDGSDITGITVTNNRVIGTGLGGAIGVVNAASDVVMSNITIQSNILDGANVANTTGMGFIGNLNGVNAHATSSAQSNIIHNFASGVRVMTLGASPTNISLFGNNIYDNTNHGIDLCADTDFDFVCDSSAGHTSNDAGDPDSGANAYINHPVVTGASQVGDQLTVTLNLDAADSPTSTYRVDFYANDAADGSGYGEGQVWLGGTNVSNGNGLSPTITLADATPLDGKIITATTTAVNATVFGGYGMTSEFSGVLSDEIPFEPASSSSSESTTAPNAPNTGFAPRNASQQSTSSSLYLLVGAAGLALAGAAVIVRRRKSHRR